MITQKKTDEQLLKEYKAQQQKLGEKVSKVKARMAKKEHERKFKIYKNVYDAMLEWFKRNNVTDDMIYNMDAKKLRNIIFGENQKY